MKRIKFFILIMGLMLFFAQVVLASGTCNVEEEGSINTSGMYYATYKDNKLWLYERLSGSDTRFGIEVVDVTNPSSPVSQQILPFDYKDAYSYSAGSHLFDFVGSNNIIAVGTKPANLIDISSQSSTYVNLNSDSVEEEIFSYGNYVYANGKNDNYIDIYEFKNNSLVFLKSYEACGNDKEVAKISFVGNDYMGISCSNYSESKYYNKVFQLTSSTPNDINFEISNSSFSPITYISSSTVYLWSPDSNDYSKGTLKIYNLQNKSLSKTISMNGCSRTPEIYGDYSVCVKDEMGFMLYDLNSGDKIAEWEDQDSNIWGAIPFSENNELYIALWAIWLGKDQKSGVKIFKITNCSTSPSSGDTTSDDTPSYCSEYNVNTQSFSLNCARIGNEFYSLSMKLVEATGSQILFQVYNSAKISQATDENCSYFDFFTNTFHVPCIKVGDKLYKIDLYLTTPDGKLNLKSVDYYSE